MRILTVSLGYPKYPGEETAPFMDGIVRGLAARGHEIDVVLPHHPEFRQPSGDGVRFFPYRYSPSPRFSPWGFGSTFNPRSTIRWEVAPLLPVVAVALSRCIRRRLSVDQYDVLHAHWVVPNAWLSSSLARRHDVPLVVTLHGTDVAMAERYRMLGRLAGRTLEIADAVTATSDDLRRRSIALGARESRATTIYMGVDTERFSPRPPDSALRRLLGADDGTLLVVSVGRLASVKGFEYLIDAASELYGAAVAIVGDGELRSELERRVSQSPASVALAGSMPHDRIGDVMSAADVVVVPSVIDRAGRVDATTSTLLEAMACGRPVVASSVGGIPEIVTHGYNGLLVPPKDSQALAAAIKRLQNDATLRRDLALRGREFAVDRLGWEATASAFEATYARVLDERMHATTAR
jgi:glycosyltransferase involved in cell wall biosynthesis